ncbi:MAG: S8 family serine peptidase, partial [Bacteroidales bacterium]|nr:S8 family serine peptidase [Bacteroidales bacterium]
MTRSIVPILCYGLIICMLVVPSSAAVPDSGLWGLYGSGNSANLIVLPPGILERIEKSVACSNTPGEDTINASELSDGIKPEIDKDLFLSAITPERPLYKPGSIIVRFKPDVAGSPGRLAEISDAVHTKQNSIVTMDYSDIGLPGMQVLQLPEDITVAEAVAAYSRDPNVLYAEPNYYYYADSIPVKPDYQDLLAAAPTLTARSGSGDGSGGGRIPDDPLFDELWGLHNTGQTIEGKTGTVDADIDAPEAWSLTTGSRDVIIAVIDSGVMYTHPDLAANIWENPGEIPGNGIDDDGNGYIDDVYGWDFYDDDNDPDDLTGHGTHCAGTIAAVGDNAVGIAGVMWDAKIMPLRFLGPDGKGYTADAIRAIRYATDMGADIISCSWGGGNYSQALKDAIDETPALVVCAAGNDALDNDLNPEYPSSYDCENIIAVAASNSAEDLASFSNFGATSVDVAAPGESILSTCITEDWVEVYYDPMDSLDAWDTTYVPRGLPWGLNTSCYTSPPSSADDSPAGNYAPNTEAWLTTKDPISLDGLHEATLYFNARWDLEEDYDMLYVVSSLDDKTYKIHGYLTGSSEGKWRTLYTSLSMYDEDPVYIGFILETDGSVQKDGVLIDDVCIMGIESFSADYEYLSGTSMATPHVSGVAGLVLSVNASLNATEIKDIITSTADVKPAYMGKTISGGRINAYEAVRAAIGGTSFVDVLSLDPRLYPTIKGYVYVNSTRGLAGLLGISDFAVTENGVDQT